ncbi:MAG: ATP synthase F1 subunit delta [Myxococcales bacterium]|nr:ATP synthase F1 subunit delta [Myxococcales bacterium]
MPRRRSRTSWPAPVASCSARRWAPRSPPPRRCCARRSASTIRSASPIATSPSSRAPRPRPPGGRSAPSEKFVALVAADPSRGASLLLSHLHPASSIVAPRAAGGSTPKNATNFSDGAPMIAGSIARRYAKALLEIGVANKTFDALNREVENAASTFASSQELATALDNPIFPLSKRKGLLEEIARRLALSKVVRNFLLLLLERGRITALPAIARELRALVDQHAGRVRARISTARPLAASVEARLKAALEKRTGKAVIIEKVEDPSLLGGIVTQIGDLVYDGSVRTQLQNLRQQLLAD